MDELIKELKEQGVLKSPLVEAAFRAVDRKDFVLPGEASEAYANYPLSIGFGQTISQPYTVAFMLDLLDPRPGEKILDIGAGSGWTTALLASIVSPAEANQESHLRQSFGRQARIKNQGTGKVFAVERIRELCAFAKGNIEKYNFVKKGIVELMCSDATEGLTRQAPFDKIIAAAAAEGTTPDAWRKQLKVGGKIVAPVDGSIWLYEKKSKSEWEEKEFPGFAFVPLIKDRHKPAGGGLALKRMPRFLFSIYFLFSVFFLSSVYAAFVPVRLAAPVKIDIPPGAGSRAIGGILKSEKLVRSKWIFVAFATVSGKAGELKPGTYQFEGSIAVPELTRQIGKGERYPNERFITIPEGWDVRDIGEYFEKAGIMGKEEWWKIAGFPAIDYDKRRDLPKPRDFSGGYEFLRDKPKNVGLEGFLFPDTYRIYRRTSAEDIAEKMLENFNAKLNSELRAEIARQKKTIFLVVTMASILEKEIPNHEERKIASGILWKRLSLGMPLQVDATINYVTGRRETPSSSDLAVNSPYNTYRYAGLPIGPISNPGMEAILAATSPKESDYLYYLSTRDGQTVFSRTLAEHNIAKAKYLK